ncbi:MAG: helix-turn-helix transcriptional regulator [Clostridiales bacterium]|nr:helix-turn-helix transcriptional regulator [Clostridiales bacterium]
MKNLKRIRKENNLTQLALQLKTGIDQAMLSKYETGERVPTVENLCILANFFGTSLDFLMDRTDEKEPYEPKRVFSSDNVHRRHV